MIRIDLNSRLNGKTARLPRWASYLVMTGVFALGVLLFLVAASLALVLIPIALIGGAIAAWQIRRKMRAAGIDPQNPFGAGQPRPSGVETIDAEYRVIDTPERR